MTTMTRRTAITLLGAGGALAGLGYLLGRAVGQPAEMGGRMMGPGMMGSASQADMSLYMEMFNRHREISRTVEEIPGGVRTITEAHSPELVAQLQAHVSSMYAHVEQGTEVTCMSSTLPTLFRHSSNYRRQLTLTANGVIAEETTTDPALAQTIRAHADEVTGFVRDGMPAMMGGMMGPTR